MKGAMMMETNMTFRMDSDLKAEMTAICARLGMTTGAAFNIFADALVRAKGMPFTVTIQKPAVFVPEKAMLDDTDQLLDEFASDYEKMAE